jgi:hypothetical protein
MECAYYFGVPKLSLGTSSNVTYHLGLVPFDYFGSASFSSPESLMTILAFVFPEGELP